MDAISSRAFTSQARKLKVKWTEQMNKDVLECKKKAQELISSENPPCKENGRKRGYIDVMKELWDDMGYKNLQLKSQNLRDQASRLEKIRNNGPDLSIRERSVEDPGNITSTSEYSSQENIENESQNNQIRESGNANSPTRGLNLHSAEPLQIPTEAELQWAIGRMCLMMFLSVYLLMRLSTCQDRSTGAEIPTGE